MALPTYTYSGVCYTADGTETTFALTTSGGESIGYLRQEHIHVETSDDSGDTWTGLSIDTDYVFADPATSVVLNDAPEDGTVVRLKRITPLDDDYVEFQAGSLLTAEQLNTFDTWQLYIDQELKDDIGNIDGSTAGNAVKSVTGTAPIEVNNDNTQTPVVSIDETKSDDDPNTLDSDTAVMSEKAIDRAFKQYVGSGPSTTEKQGQLRIDDTGSENKLFFWKTDAWVEISVKGEKGDAGPTGPAPGLQDPAASATNISLKSDGTLGDATAQVQQDPTTKDLKFIFGVPVGKTGEKGDTGDQGPTGAGVDYKGLIDATTASEPTDPSNGDLYINTGDGSCDWSGVSEDISNGDRLIYNSATDVWDVAEPPPVTGALEPGDDVSELVNDAGYLTNADLPDPVIDSVNGETGVVELGLQDILSEGNTTTEDIYIGTGPKITLTASNGNASFAGKITSAETASGDSDATLATKGYVDENGGGDDPNAVKLDDGGTKQVIESAGLGISDGADENITLGADGSAVFVADPGTFGTTAGVKILETGSVRVARTTDGPVFQGNKTDGSGYNATINANGTAEFLGDVRIGTDTEGSDNAKNLTIGASGNSGMTLRSGTTNNGAIYFSDATSGDGEFDGYIQYEHNNRQLRIGTASTSRVLIDSTGDTSVTGDVNVGAEFDSGDGVHALSNGALYVRKDGTGAGDNLFTVLNGGSATGNQVARINGDGSASFAGDITLTAGTTDWVIRPGGNSNLFGRVDIGSDASPISGTAMYMNTDDDASYAATLNLRNQGSGPSLIARDAAGNDCFRVESGGGGSFASNFVVRPSGTTSIGAGLTIGSSGNGGNNAIAISTSVITTGAGSSTLKYNTSTAIVTYDTSSRLVKDNIVDCPYGIETLKQIKPRKYFRTDDQHDEVGFVADELLSVVPELVPVDKKSLVTRKPEDTQLIPIGVNYEKMTAVLAKALQEAVEKIEVLEGKVAALEAK